MTKLIRWTLTIFLVYGAYTETGIFTTLSLLLVFLFIETLSWYLGKELSK
jgi:hypothetical protein